MYLSIDDAGLDLRLVDSGRFGYGAFGIGQSGVFDPRSYELLTKLLSSDFAIEYRHKSPQFSYQGAPVFLAANVAIWRNQTEIPAFHMVEISSGDRLKFENAYYGLITFGAEIDAPRSFGSISYDEGAGLGLQLKKGSVLSLHRAKALRAFRLTPPSFDACHLRVILGPQADSFFDDAIESFLTTTFTVSKLANRMGLRLEGEKILAQNQTQLASDAVIPGAIQIPPSGEPILLGPDAQTLGGYPKIATIISADLFKLAHLRPDDSVCFTAVTRDEAIEAARREADTIADCLHAKSHIIDIHDSARLFGLNLIDGAITGRDEGE